MLPNGGEDGAFSSGLMRDGTLTRLSSAGKTDEGKSIWEGEGGGHKESKWTTTP